VVPDGLIFIDQAAKGRLEALATDVVS